MKLLPTFYSSIALSFLILGCQNTQDTQNIDTPTLHVEKKESSINTISQRHINRDKIIIKKLLQLASDEINSAPSLQRSFSYKKSYSAKEIEEFFSNSSKERGLLNEIYTSMDKKVDELAQFLNDLNAQDSIDYRPALTLEYVTELEKNKLLVSNETIIDVTTLEGEISAKILNAIAQGEDLNTLLEVDSNERSFILGITQPWKDNTVIYKDELSSVDTYGTHSSQMQKALREWESGTNIKFYNYDEQSRWTKYLIKLGLKRYSTFTNADMSNSGGLAYATFLGVTPLLPTNIVIGNSINYPRAFAHELEHLLGLMHEHQRGDRDEFITLPTEADPNNFNYIKVPLALTTQGLQIAYYTKESCYLGICKNVAYPYLASTTSSINLSRYSKFDYASIMLYQSFTTNKELYKITQTGEITTDFNKTINMDYEHKAIGEILFANKHVSKLDYKLINELYQH